MPQRQVAPGVNHPVTPDIKSALVETPDLLAKWNSLTPLARNEWICWITIVKTEETRSNHISRMREEILGGKRRPCCWPGCPHHNPTAKKWFKK